MVAIFGLITNDWIIRLTIPPRLAIARICSSVRLRPCVNSA